MKRILMAAAVMVSGIAFAGPSVGVPAGTGKFVEPKLSCPAGAKQGGGLNSRFEASVCLKGDTLHGSYVGYYPSGAKQAEGQFVDGSRDGLWTFFDQSGNKVGETNFKNDSYDGLRVEFHANGQKKLEEMYVAGKREGMQKTFDQQGRVMQAITFADGRMVAAK